ncbi:hypothetical protein [Myroides phaeus]|uniref:Uncharacterized protein n=1 Tax=Myroides phaeus TaxID=702745 RepID=A0A1G8CN39_9FLAO|nr:hypothetical protein [Myroides phaeus]SDH46719.1 hypothetical protein SAMN05421818_104129 [Myroides phaeus]
MKKVLFSYFLIGSVLIASCSDDKERKDQEKADKEAQLDLKIKEADRLFKKYGWENDPEIDRNSKEFREEYEEMDLKQLEGFLKQMKEGVIYNDTIVNQIEGV